MTNLNTCCLEGLSWVNSFWHAGSKRLYLFVWYTNEERNVANYPEINSSRKRALCRLRVHGNVTTPAAASEWQVLCEKVKKHTDKETLTQIWERKHFQHIKLRGISRAGKSTKKPHQYQSQWKKVNERLYSESVEPKRRPDCHGSARTQ